MRNILVTSSLPYANGDIHLGHMLEYMQTDIWARFQRMRDNHCYYICGTDAHGTPVMIRAEKDGTTPEKLVAEMRERHIKDFADFDVVFDCFHSTHSAENHQLTEMIYQRLAANGDIKRKTIQQAYDPAKNMFLPDRYVKGECPKCGAADQYGDSCDACGATYNPLEMKNPISTLSGETPITKASEHYFFDLSKYQDFLKEWVHTDNHLQKPISHKLDEWFQEGLQAWDISRDKPYFGFKIPETDNKYFYVWLDAPIGYLASFEKFCQQHSDINFDDIWGPNSSAEVYHFVGKDVVYFHSLFWPAVLNSANIRLPNAVYAHGFLTVNGQKMSKSRGTFIKARTYLNHLNPQYLRYYFAAKLNNGIEDLDLNLDDFKTKVNADLVGKVINIASRCAGFISKRFNGILSEHICEPELWQQFMKANDTIANYYENRQYAFAMREIMRLADIANQYIADKAPWALVKEGNKEQQVHDICSLGINLFRILTIYLQPVLPGLSKQVSAFLNESDYTWKDAASALSQHKINKFKPLMVRVEEEKIQAMLDETEKEFKSDATPKGILADEPIKDEITIDDFAKIDLRVAKVIAADHVDGADKLLQLKLDIGGEQRQVFAGIKSAYKPEDLIGKHVAYVANLKPRKMRFGISEGMVLATGPGGKDSWVINPSKNAKPGMKIK